MSGQFPESKPDWSNVEVFRRNTLPPRSYFFSYENEADALAADSARSCSVLLSGTWKFHHANSPFEAPEGFALPEYDSSKWSDIQVPGHWQLQGWEHPIYTNVPYPFFVDPPNVPYNDNQTGSYVRKFTIPTEFADQQVRIRFEGVDSAFHVYINGTEVGYSQGSRNPSEFDISSLLGEGENTLAVRVYQYSDGSYLEDQDQWRFSGIFRDVFLLAFPKVRIRDFHVQTALDDEYEDAELKVRVDIEGREELHLKLLDQEGQVIASESRQATEPVVDFSIKLSNPRKWSAEEPYLYKLVLSYGNRLIAQNVGFRRIEIKNGIYLVNGRRIVFRGANRHEHHPQCGRAVPYEFMKNDLLLMKRHNINAIRTCHQPSDPRLYALADELGFWVMDEADVECHGFSTICETALAPADRSKSFEEKKVMVQGEAAQFTSDNPVWEKQYVDRALQLCARDKNHPCVIMWSLGNEAFYGRNFQSMYNAIKDIDQTRPIHYEGDFEAETVDLFSRMYPNISDIVEFAKEHNFKKPLVLCEYVHAMGNGPGNIKEYIDAFYEHPRLQGGWVWEWANHGLKKKDGKTGHEYYAYGGDFGDEPNDVNFIMDGVLFSDHTPTPGLTEYKKAIEPVQVKEYTDGKVKIVNRYDLKTLDHLTCQGSLIGDGFQKTFEHIAIPAGMEPHTTGNLDLSSLALSDIKDEAFVQLDFRLKEATLWAAQGHLIASSQVQVRAPEKATRTSTSTTALTLTATRTTLSVTAEASTFSISLASGVLTSWRKHSSELIHQHEGPQLTFYRALTDNDRPQDGQDWVRARVNHTKQHVRNVTWSTSDSEVTVSIESKYGPSVLSWYIHTTTVYTFRGDGTWHVQYKGSPQGLNLPPTLPRVGIEFVVPASFENVSWFGRGPGESYKDKKLSQNVGNWSASVDELFTNYEFPQETSNRTDVRWVKFGSTPSAMNSVTRKVSALASRFGGVVSTGTANIPNPVMSTGTTTSITQSGTKAASSTDDAKDTASPSFTAKFGTQEGFSFMASHYSCTELDEARHPFELREMRKLRKDCVFVRLDADHHGLGTGSCGPKTLENYALKTQPFEFEIDFE
jgi:beta-galactosidase